LVLGRRSALAYATVAAVAVALYRPLHADLHAGQVYTLLALFYTLWLYGFVVDGDWIAGAGLAGLVLLKLAGWPLWLLMIAARRWRALGWAIGLGAAVGLLTLPLFGLDFWLTYLLRQAPALSADPSIASPGHQTLISLLHQLFVYDARWSPRPLVDAPWLASLVWWALAVALLGLTLWRAMRALSRGAGAQGDARIAAARGAMALLCLVVPLQPAGEEHHYTLLLVVVLVLLLVPRVALGGSPLALAMTALGCVLLLVPFYYVGDGWVGWPQALLAYPRMSGALLLWGAIVYPAAGVRASAAEQVRMAHS